MKRKDVETDEDWERYLNEKRHKKLLKDYFGEDSEYFEKEKPTSRIF